MVNNDFEVKIISVVHIFCRLKNDFEVKINVGTPLTKTYLSSS